MQVLSNGLSNVPTIVLVEKDTIMKKVIAVVVCVLAIGALFLELSYVKAVAKQKEEISSAQIEVLKGYLDRNTRELVALKAEHAKVKAAHKAALIPEATLQEAAKVHLVQPVEQAASSAAGSVREAYAAVVARVNR